jgi:hypothetical protein
VNPGNSGSSEKETTTDISPLSYQKNPQNSSALRAKESSEFFSPSGKRILGILQSFGQKNPSDLWLPIQNSNAIGTAAAGARGSAASTTASWSIPISTGAAAISNPTGSESTAAAIGSGCTAGRTGIASTDTGDRDGTGIGIDRTTIGRTLRIIDLSSGTNSI